MTGIPILTKEPERVTSGDTLKWKIALSLYPASTWTLTYELRSVATSSTAIQITATDSSDDHLVTVLASVTAVWVAGDYSWDAYVTSGTERKKVGFGIITVLRDLATVVAEYDDRTHAKKILDALEAVFENRASEIDLSYSVGGRSISKMSHDERIKTYQFYKGEVENEKVATGLAQGLGTSRKIRIRFASGLT